MPRLRTILAMATVVVVSVAAAHLHGSTVINGTSTASAALSVDGVRQTVTVVLPAGAVSHLQGPVAISVTAPGAHAVTTEDLPSGAFPLAISFLEADVTPNEPETLTATTVVHADLAIGVRVELINAAGKAASYTGTSDTPLLGRFLPNLPTLTAQLP